MARVGVFVPGSSSGGDQFQLLVKVFRDGLRELGWIEGQTVVIETRWGEGRLDEFPKMVSELVVFPVDVLVAWGPQAIRAAQQASGTVPIVMAIVHEPVAFGFVRSLARPGGNITGSAFQDSELGTSASNSSRRSCPACNELPSFGIAAALEIPESARSKKRRGGSPYRPSGSKFSGVRISRPPSCQRRRKGRRRCFRSRPRFSPPPGKTHRARRRPTSPNDM